jgi:protein-tyrosine phosphatase
MKILFVCSGNAHRSPLAEALLKKMRPDLTVDSAGLHIAIPVAREVAEYLAKENAEQYLKKVPEHLDGKKLEDYDLIVAMEQRHKDAVTRKCPSCEPKTVVWNVQDPYFMNKEDAITIYQLIKEKVEKLAEKL